jgi:hypothetical protein
MRPVQIPYFRIWYSITFVVLFLIAVALTLITPADLVYQTVHGAAGPKTNVISVAATYLGTFLACCFLWAARLYTNRSVLAAIPKSYLPITASDLPAKVRRLVARNARRSALVAWDSRPRDVSRELAPPDGRPPAHHHHHLPHLHLHLHRRHDAGAGVIPAAAAARAWGCLEHAGWAPPRGPAPSPSAAAPPPASRRGGPPPPAPSAPAVRYAAVVAELPHLLEAKAVSLAPPLPRPATLDPAAAASERDEEEDEEEEVGEADPALVALLRRPDRAGLRAYVAHLSALGLVPHAGQADAFVRRYEDARFAARAVSARDFERLMAAFAALLAALRLPDGGIALGDDGEEQEEEEDDDDVAVGLGVGIGDDDHANSSDRYATSATESADGGGSVRRLSRSLPVDGSAYETSDFYSFGEDEDDGDDYDDASLRAASPYEPSMFHSVNSETSSVMHHQRDDVY